MSDVSLHERSYRLLVRFYPGRFRREFGDALVQFFRDDVRTRGATRAWRRALSDLVVSIPVQHVEVAVMHRSSRTLAMLGLPLIAAAAAMAFGRLVVLTVPLALAFAVGAYLSSRRAYNEKVSDVSARWWRVLGTGVLILAGVLAAGSYGPDFEWFPWFVVVFTWLVGWGFIIVGALLGIVRLGRSLRARPANAA